MENVLGHYIKLKADEKLISPVCSESVESLLQIYGFFLKMQIYSSMNSSRPFIWTGNLHNIDFIRTQTLCQGGEKCDFCFVRHRKGEAWERSESV